MGAYSIFPAPPPASWIYEESATIPPMTLICNTVDAQNDKAVPAILVLKDGIAEDRRLWVFKATIKTELSVEHKNSGPVRSPALPLGRKYWSD